MSLNLALSLFANRLPFLWQCNMSPKIEVMMEFEATKPVGYLQSLAPANFLSFKNNGK